MLKYGGNSFQISIPGLLARIDHMVNTPTKIVRSTIGETEERKYMKADGYSKWNQVTLRAFSRNFFLIVLSTDYCLFITNCFYCLFTHSSPFRNATFMVFSQ